jgi:hypothetical protein
MHHRRLRYTPDEHYLIIEYLNNKKHKRRLIGLVRDESYNGCCALFRQPFPFKTGDNLVFKLGRAPELHGEIKWVEPFDEVFVKVGINISV